MSHSHPNDTEGVLLAVDMGLRTGLALFARSGRLLWHRSHNLGDRSRLKKAVFQILRNLPQLEVLLIEGGGALAEIWARQGERKGVDVVLCHASDWRKTLLLPREQRNGPDAKKHAISKALQVIENSGLACPKSLRHDAAEAILAGAWFCEQNRWDDLTK